MVSLLCHVHFWTLKALSPGTASGCDIGTHLYHEKTPDALEGVLNISRKEWALGRDITWVPRNKKPEKLRDTLRECEELLSNHRPVAMKWKGTRHCLVLLDNAVLITYTVSRHSGDIERIFLDKSMMAKIGAKVRNAVFVGDSMVLTTSSDGGSLCLVTSMRKHVSSSSHHNPLTLTHTDSARRLEKLSTQDLKVSHLSMEGVPSDQVRCHLIYNVKEDLVALWWRDEQEEGWTWSSMAHGSKENLLIFTLTGDQLQYCAGVQTDSVPLSMAFSNTRGNILYSLEKTGSTEYTPVTYEYANERIWKASSSPPVTSMATILICERNRNESLLLFGCENGTLILYNSSYPKGKVKKTKTLISPISLVRWHPTGTLAFICSAAGSIQCFDIGLNCLYFQVLSEDPEPLILLPIGSHFVAPAHLEVAGWGSSGKEEKKEGCYDNFMIVFGNGPLVLLRVELGVLSRGNLRPLEVVSEYIQHNDVAKAISILESLDWNYQQNDSFSCLTVLLNHLLVQPLTPQTEYDIEAALATFGATPITAQITNRYKPHIVNLQRRYFHLLVRCKRLEKAYEVALSIQARDLFMDIHFLAVGLNEFELAEKARQNAEDLLSAESADIGMTWMGRTRQDWAHSSGDSPRGRPDSSCRPHSDDDISHALQSISILSFSFNSLASDLSNSPLTEQTTKTSVHSATPHSELEVCSDNEGTETF